MQFFRDIRFETKYILEELWLKMKHPTRKGDLGHHWSNLMGHFFFHPWYCLKRGIRNLWVWFPLIWGNDVFDHSYLTALMDKQLKEMEEFFLSGRCMSMRANHDGRRIRWTRKLYTLWMDDHYTMIHYYAHKERFKTVSIFEESIPCAWDEFGIPTLYESNTKMSEEESEAYREGSLLAHEKDEKLFKLYMKNLSKLRNWWD